MNEERKGELFIFSAGLFWSLFPILTILSLSNIGPLFALSATSFFALIFFTFVVSYKRKWAELKEKTAIKDAVWAALFLGVFFYSLYFVSLNYTTAGNASLIARMSIFTSFLFFNVIHREHITWKQMLGAVLMVVGAVIVMLPGVLEDFAINIGDLIMLLVICMNPIGNFFQRRARKTISGETILFIRTLVVVPVTFVLALLFGETIKFQELGHSLPYIIIIGFLLFGISKMWWIEGIHRISVTKAEALGALGPLLTLFFAYIILKEAPTVFQLLSFIPLSLGVFFLTRDKMDPKSL